MDNIETVSNIKEFYKGKTIFITGATGFIGKALTEKLLRSCSEVKALYLLVRDKKGKKSEDRLQEIFSDRLFNRLRKEEPDFHRKVFCITGNLKLSNLGISPEDYENIINEVSVIFHVGATVKFNQTLKETLIINFCGTKNLIDLAKNMSNLEALVHISTAYCNTHEKDIYEEVYPTDFPTIKIFDCLSWMDDDMFELLRSKLLRRHPNNYCYSKGLAEQLLHEEKDNIPVVIVRPSMVISTLKEPVEGWITDFSGIANSAIAYGRGLIRTLQIPDLFLPDLIPVDLCVNMIIASAWDKARKGCGDTTVYNCTSGTTNRIEPDRVIETFLQSALKYPSLKAYRYPYVMVIQNPVLNFIFDIYLHFLPAVILDVGRFLSGRKIRMVSLYKKLSTMSKLTDYFLKNSWNFYADNFICLLNGMSQTDKKIFDFDVRGIDWPEYIEKAIRSGRQYILNEDPSTLPTARKRLYRLYYYEVIGNTIVIGGAISVLLLILWYFIF